MIPRKLLLLVIPLLLAILWWSVQAYVHTEVENTIIKNEIKIEGKIQNAIKESKKSNPTNNPNVSLDGLRGALSDWD